MNTALPELIIEAAHTAQPIVAPQLFAAYGKLIGASGTGTRGSI